MAKRIKVSRKAHDTNINEFSMTFNHELGLYALKGESGGIENPYDIDRITYYFTEDQVKDYVNEFLFTDPDAPDDHPQFDPGHPDDDYSEGMRDPGRDDEYDE